MATWMMTSNCRHSPGPYDVTALMEGKSVKSTQFKSKFPLLTDSLLLEREREIESIFVEINAI